MTDEYPTQAVRSAQELFDFISEKLFLQGAPSRVGVHGTCLYRGNERRCAVGWIIPDEIYRPSFEGKDLQGLFAEFGDILPEEIKTHKSLLQDLQCVHDGFSEFAGKITFREHLLYSLAELGPKHNISAYKSLGFYGMTKHLPVLGHPSDFEPIRSEED